MAGLNVSRWQAGKRPWNYSPVMQFSKRLIDMAVFEALRVQYVPCPYRDLLWSASPDGVADHLMHVCGETWDMAIMARDWIRRGAPDPKQDLEGYYLSFDHCCEVLGLNVDYERTLLLSRIDTAADFDTDECWARVEYLTENPPDEMEEELFDAVRVVPALDQGCLFAMGA